MTSIGCQAYSPYGYGQYPGGFNSRAYQQPGMYGAPGMAPGTMVVPPGSGYPGAYPGGIQAAPPYNPGPGYNSGPVTPATPYPTGPTGPTGGGNQGADTSTDPLGQSGSFPRSSSTRPQIPADGKLVPYYSDPDTSTQPRRVPAVTPTDIGDPADFKGTINGAEKATQRLKGIETESAKPPGVSLIESEADAIQFAPPADRSAANGIQTVEHTQAAGGPQNLSPYGRAPNGQDWFRGLVDYDEQENTWYLIYNPEPGAEDRQGGTITLIEHPNLKLVRGDDVVLVEGRFDPTQSDQHGHAKYRVNVVRRLIP